MPEYLDDPSVLTKEKLKNELLAHNVELPGGHPTKDVYVQLYLRHLTALNHKGSGPTVDTFSSDEEPPPPVVSTRSRSSGRKATKKTDKVRPDELDVSELTDASLKDQLQKYGVDAGPIVASTRKLYEKKLQKLLDQGPPEMLQPKVVVTEIDFNHNGNSDSDRYSDKEEEVTAIPEPQPEPEPEPEPEPTPVVDRPLRSRGKTPVTTRTRSSQHNRIDEPVNDDGFDEEVPFLNLKHRPRRSSRRLEPLPLSFRDTEALGLSPTAEPTPRLPHGVSKLVPKNLRPFLANQDLVEPSRLPDHQQVIPDQGDSPSLFPVLTKEPKCDVAGSIGKSIGPQNRGPLLKGLPMDPSPLRAATPYSFPTPVVNQSRVNPVTFRPLIHILSINNKDECVLNDVQLHKQKQRKMAPFFSSPTPGEGRGDVEKISAGDQTPKVDEQDILKELFPNEISTPTGISVTCRRPIRGAAPRPIISSDLWTSESLLRRTPKTSSTSTTSSYTETRSVHRATHQPPSTPYTSSTATSRLTATAPPAGQAKAARQGLSLWIKLLLLAAIVAFLFFVYQTMETDAINPFGGADTPQVADSPADQKVGAE